MLIINGKQYIEGIDGIDLLIQPYLYSYFNPNSIQLDQYNKISIYPKSAKFPSSEGGFSYKSIGNPPALPGDSKSLTFQGI